MKLNFSRRNFLAFGAATAALAVASPALASTAEAERHLQNLFAAMTQAVTKSAGERTRRFERILTQFGDMRSLAHNALGREIRSLNPSQIQQFTTAFKTYMAKKYGRALAKQRINGLTIESSSIKHDRRGTPYFLIKAKVHRSGKGSVNAEFKLTNTYKFFNMAIEGINMLLSERRAIADIFDQQPHFNAVLEALLKG